MEFWQYLVVAAILGVAVAVSYDIGARFSYHAGTSGVFLNKTQYNATADKMIHTYLCEDGAYYLRNTPSLNDSKYIGYQFYFFYRNLKNASAERYLPGAQVACNLTS